MTVCRTEQASARNWRHLAKALLVVVVIGALVPRTAGNATAGPLTGTITVQMHETYSAPGVTSSTNCSATLTLAADGTTSAKVTYSHDDQRTQQQSDNVSTVTTTHEELINGGSSSNVTRPSIYLNTDQNSYTLYFQVPAVQLKTTVTIQSTGQQQQTDISTNRYGDCPDAPNGAVGGANPAVTAGGALTGSANLRGTVQAHGDFDQSRGNGSVTITWSLNDPSLSTPAQPTPLRGGISNDTDTPTPTSSLPTGDITVEMHETHTTPGVTSSTSCSATLTLAADGTTGAEVSYTHDDEHTQQQSDNVSTVVTTHEELLNGGSFSNVPRPYVNLNPAQNSYTLYFQVPAVQLKTTVTIQSTGQQPDATTSTNRYGDCPDAPNGVVGGANPQTSVTGALTGSAQLHGTVQAHGDFDDSGGNGSVTITWTLNDPSLNPPAPLRGAVGNDTATATPLRGRVTNGTATATPAGNPPPNRGGGTATRTPISGVVRHGGTVTPTRITGPVRTATPTETTRRPQTATPTATEPGSSCSSQGATLSVTINRVSDAPNGPARTLYRAAGATRTKTVDGNTDTATVTICNGTNAAVKGTVAIADRTWGALARQTLQSPIPPRAKRTVTVRFATDGLAWKPRPRNTTRNTMLLLTASFAGKTSKAAPVAIDPRPVVMVHGLNDSYLNWLEWWKTGGFLAKAGYPLESNNRAGWAVNTMHTNGQGGITPRSAAAGLARANKIACQYYHLCNKPVACRPGNCTNTTEQNAQLLNMYIERTVVPNAHAEKVDLVAQSMGGLIARYYVSHYMPRNRVARLVMLGTPNMGSEAGLIGTLLPDNNQPATFENSPAFVENVINPAATDRKGVHFFAIGGTYNACSPSYTATAQGLMQVYLAGKNIPVTLAHEIVSKVCANLAEHCYSLDGVPSDMVVSAASTQTLPPDSPAPRSGSNPMFPYDHIATERLQGYRGLPVYHFDDPTPFKPDNLVGSALSFIYGPGNCQQMPGWDSGQGAEQTSPPVFHAVLAQWLTDRSLATPGKQ